MTAVVLNHATVRSRANMRCFLRLSAERGIDTVSIGDHEITKVEEANALAALRDLDIRVSGYNRIGLFLPEYLSRAEAELERPRDSGPSMSSCSPVGF